MKIEKLAQLAPLTQAIDLHTEDPGILRHLREEDGHDNWFFEDMEDLGLTPIFNPSHPSSILVQLVETKEVDWRLIFTIESTSKHLFTLTAQHFPDLKYFGNQHLQAELSHTIWADPKFFEGVTLHEDLLQAHYRIVDWLCQEDQ